jgi:hypothetical protein
MKQQIHVSVLIEPQLSHTSCLLHSQSRLVPDDVILAHLHTVFSHLAQTFDDNQSFQPQLSARSTLIHRKHHTVHTVVRCVPACASKPPTIIPGHLTAGDRIIISLRGRRLRPSSKPADATSDLSLHMSSPTLDTMAIVHLHRTPPNSGTTPTGDKISQQHL